MAIIPKLKFPNVPKLPGVPQLARSPLFPPAPAPVLGLALALGKLWQSIFAQPQWAIYRANQPRGGGVVVTVGGVSVRSTNPTQTDRTPVVVPDSFGEFSYRNEWSVADFPVQDGAFASYDKVSNPFEIVIRMYKGGSKQARKRFLDSIEAIAGTLELYDIVTPERTYLNVNVTRYELSRRGAGGAYFLSEVDLFFREIRTVTASYSATAVETQNAQDPSAAPVVNTGSVQGQEVPNLNAFGSIS